MNTESTIIVRDKKYKYYSLKKANDKYTGLKNLPKTLKIILENLLRFQDGKTVFPEDLEALDHWVKNRGRVQYEISFRPARVLMQDFTGVPAIVDLAAMRSALKLAGKDPKLINPEIQADLVIDHSVSVDFYASSDAMSKNVQLEYQRNRERYELLSWGQKSFKNFRVVPPGTGICHQVNLEYLGKTVCQTEEKTAAGDTILIPDTLVGTDSHTTMINSLAVLGWGVGGIEAEAAMLGQPISLSIPEVVGFKFTGKLKEGITATDLVLTVTSILRKTGVVGKFVEFFGAGLSELALENRATISNMAPEYGATCAFFPVDEETLRYLKATGRTEEEVNIVEVYSKEQGLWRSDDTPDPVFSDVVELDLTSVEPSLAGPKRPQDRIALSQAAAEFSKLFKEDRSGIAVQNNEEIVVSVGDVMIAAITSCTNTSNPSVIIAAGLLARNAVERGLTVGPKVKTSLAPGSQVVAEYLQTSGLQKYLNNLGFYIAGFGCTTCIGNSGPLAEPFAKVIEENNLTVASVLSGNRNFEGRIHSHIKASYLASPPLVVAYALAGSMKVDITREPLGKDKEGRPVYLADIWPKENEIFETIRRVIHKNIFIEKYSSVFDGDENWSNISSSQGGTDFMTYSWKNSSTYVQEPPYFKGIKSIHEPVQEIVDAGILGIFGDSVTTDHISPAGSIPVDGPAGKYLKEKGVNPADFNSFGSRRGNHEVMVRGTFANIRIKNLMVEKTGGYTVHFPSGEVMPIYDAAMKYGEAKKPLVIFAGKEYGTGSSRDWAAKGTLLLGVRAVICESFERIHRSNLLGMGILPLTLTGGKTIQDLNLEGSETVSIPLHERGENLKPGQILKIEIKFKDNKRKIFEVQCRIDTAMEMEYYVHGGILPYSLRKLL